VDTTGEPSARPTLALVGRRVEIAEAVRRHGGRDPRVFGSVARGTDVPGSDLDLLVTFDPGRDVVDLLALQAELSAMLAVPVDVVSTGSSGELVRRASAEALPPLTAHPSRAQVLLAVKGRRRAPSSSMTTS
jgi:predicted nucleotidyltransferase